MTSRQRARRLLIWRGSFPAITVFAFLMLLSALADRVTHEKARELSSQVEQHLAAGGRFSRSEPAQINPPPPERSAKIDPDTVLKRRRPAISLAERKALRKLAEAL